MLHNPVLFIRMDPSSLLLPVPSSPGPHPALPSSSCANPGTCSAGVRNCLAVFVQATVLLPVLPTNTARSSRLSWAACWELELPGCACWEPAERCLRQAKAAPGPAGRDRVWVTSGRARACASALIASLVEGQGNPPENLRQRR